MSNVVVRTNEFSTIWPLLLDYNQRECLQILRRLELEAYSKIVAVLRAQGPLTEEKKKLLHKLQRLLSISIDRHKAEVRKALNDEELATISEAVCGKEVDEEWILEGKRISPIFQRPSPETIFISQANKASFEQLIRNSRLPCPAETATFSETFIKLAKLNDEKVNVKQQSVEQKFPPVVVTNDKVCDISVNESKTDIHTVNDSIHLSQNKNENNIKLDNLNKLPEKCSPVKTQNNPLVKSLLEPKTTSIQSPSIKDNNYVVDKSSLDVVLPQKMEISSSLQMDNQQENSTLSTSFSSSSSTSYTEVLNAKNQVLSNQLTLLPVVTRESSSSGSSCLLKSENTSLVNCISDTILNKPSKTHESVSSNEINMSTSVDAQFTTPATTAANVVTYAISEPRTVQPVFSQINRIPITTTITSGKVLNSSNYSAVHGLNLSSLPSSSSAHTSQHLVVQMHRNPDDLLDSSQQVLTTTQRCSLINPTNSVYVCEHSTPTATRLCSTSSPSHINNFTTNSNKLYQPISRSNLDNVIGVKRHHQQQQPHTLSPVTPSVLSIQSLHNSTTPSQRFRAPQSQPPVVSTNETPKQLSSITQIQNPKILKATIPVCSNVLGSTTYASNMFCSSVINITTDNLPINNNTDQLNRTSLPQQNTLIPSSSVVQFPSSISGNNSIQNTPTIMTTTNAISKSSSSHLLHHSSRLGSILEVDLDSDNYSDQTNYYSDYHNATIHSNKSTSHCSTIVTIPQTSLSIDVSKLTPIHHNKPTVLTDELSVVNLLRTTTSTTNSNNDLHNTSSGLYTIINEQSLNNNRLPIYSESEENSMYFDETGFVVPVISCVILDHFCNGKLS
uniref:Protein EMSY n=1 Tax=Schistosoma haematobium TaxID=6185 RepID=A0A095C5S3_SCHHA